jgi:hypothetical protein
VSLAGCGSSSGPPDSPIRERGNFCARWENEDVTRVEWTRTEPGDIEQVVSMLLCRENPSTVRVRPSRGDGGIDVLAPARNGAGVAVYQVKSAVSFSSR